MTRLTWKRAGIVAVVLVAIGVAFGIINAGRDDTQTPPSSTQPIVLHGGQINGHKMRTKSYSFVFDRAQTSADESSASIDGLHSGVLYKDGKPYLRIAAAHVAVNRLSLDFTATGHVRVEQIPGANEPPRSFETDLVVWNNALKQLELAHPSVLRTGNQTLRVARVTVDFKKNEVRLGPLSGGLRLQR